MVYNIQNDWLFGLCPTTSTLKTRKHNISDTGYISVKYLRLALSKGPNRDVMNWGLCMPYKVGFGSDDRIY
jgi:hypothetical protein